MKAAYHGHLGVARLLLDRSADPNQARPEHGTTALMIAAAQGHLEVARLLLDRSADQNLARTDDGRTALIIAAYHGHSEVTRLLLDRSAEPNQPRTDHGYTALMYAAYHGHLEVARLLLDRSADPNLATTDDGCTALMNAADQGHLEGVQLLLLFSAEPDAQHDDGETAQAGAIRNGHPAVADCLGTIAGWPTFKIAAACRLHADARRMLHCGSVDPSDCSLAELTAVGGTPVNTLWPGSPGPCDATTALVRAVMSSWSPSRHSLHHIGVRSSVLTTLLVARRLQYRATVADALTQHQLRMLPRSSMPMIGLPNELWLVVCSFFRRSDWVVIRHG
jgi:ankyrin repeat protein